LTRSTRFTYLCTAQISKFQPNIVNIFSRMKNEFPSIFIFASNFTFFLQFFMKLYPGFATNSRKECRVSLFQSNLQKRIRKLPKILRSVKIIHYYSLLCIRVLRRAAAGPAPARRRRCTRRSPRRWRSRWSRRPGRRRLSRGEWISEWNHLQALRGSFSAVSKPMFAYKYSCESSWRDLQDLQTFAPPRPQNFSKQIIRFFSKRILAFSFQSFAFSRNWLFPANVAMFTFNIDEFLSEVCNISQKM